jgi:predicted RNA-binding Zn ribbon-like protein
MDTPDSVRLLGRALCLDFANSVDWSEDDLPVKDEVLKSPVDLGAWGRRLELGDVEPDAGELAAALDLREALHDVFVAIAHGEEPDQRARRTIARNHADATRAGELTDRDGAWQLDWDDDDPRRIRFAVANDAVALLADRERLRRVRHCPGHDCGWLFLDLSGRRRWCSMDTCGSRAKMRRLYARRRAAGDPA